MTARKTSVEKLESRNLKVSDGHSALLATRWKWREARMKVHELYGVIEHACGFCKLADLRKGDARGRCRNCQVNAKCHEIQSTASNLWDGLETMIDEFEEYLVGLKVEEIR